MREIDQSSGPTRLGGATTIPRGLGRAASTASSVVVAILIALGTARARDDADAAPSVADPVDLAADSVRAWDVGADRWVVLSGHAAALSGLDGLRAEKIVARVTPGEIEGSEGHRVELYAEGAVVEAGRPDAARRPLAKARRTLLTIKGVSLKAFQKGGLAVDAGPPKNEPIVARAFPAPKAPAALGPGSRGELAARAGSTRASSAPTAAASPVAPLGPPPAELRLPALPSETAGGPGTARAEVSAPVDPMVRQATTQVPGPATDAPDPFAQDPPPVPPTVDEPGEPGRPADLAPPVDFQDPPPPGGMAPGRRGGSGVEVPPSELPEEEPEKPREIIPIDPNSLRTFLVNPRDGGNDLRTGEPLFRFNVYQAQDGTVTYVIRGGVNVVVEIPKRGTVDLSADNVVIWTRKAPGGNPPTQDAEGRFLQDDRDPLECYLEGNVIVRQDQRKYAGNPDARVFRAPRAYYNLRTERLLALDGQADLFAPGLVTPFNVKSPEINQYRPTLAGADGRPVLGRSIIRAERTSSTGSRFPTPGYRFDSKSVDIYQLDGPPEEPNPDIPIGFGLLGFKSLQQRSPEDLDGRSPYRIDARQNVFFNGPVPIFYSPRFLADSDDLSPALRQISPRYINYFGFQILLDFNAFKLFNIPKPKYIDDWSLDIDYLLKRGPAVGTGVGWFGRDPLGGAVKGAYYGYFDFWGILDHYRIGDDLGPGPAVITNGPPGSGKSGRQRTNDPFFNQDRARFQFRHMQSLLAEDAPDDEDFRIGLEFAYQSDRNFLEQYYKYLFDSGLDQWTDIYLIKQKENRAFTVLTQANLQYWFTDTQWFPKVDYYRLGDSFLNDHVSLSGSYGVADANVHTATEVNNPNIFAFIPYDPVSNTSGPLQTGRAYVAEQAEFPINLDVVRVVPYLQGQLTGYDDQLGNTPIGRAWGAYGIKFDAEAWKRYPDVESEFLNVHGLNHKINFDVDARFAYSNVGLNRIGVLDQIDDNTYEWSRRYFALTNYVDGVLPLQYDPRLLTLRRAISPITGTTDIQSNMQTVNFGIKQRLQTKRGPEGRRRIVDYMVLDLNSTFFPDAGRDNFNKPFGQNRFNYEWYIGDRTSIISQGWFEEFNIGGNPVTISNPKHDNDPFKFSVINTGISISRPPRGSVYIAYSVINSGPITTSALLTTASYWLSPKWFGTLTNSYDFGDGILLATTASMTRIGADWLTSIGLAFDPQRKASQISLELTPRVSPNVRLGSSNAASRFDQRFAPTQ